MLDDPPPALVAPPAPLPAVARRAAPLPDWGLETSVIMRFEMPWQVNN